MILTGLYDSPFVRRVAVTLQHYGLSYERRALSVFGDQEEVRTLNPLGKAPAMQLDDGDMLFDSAAILDWLDERVGAESALLPRGGPERRTALRRCIVALGIAEKAVALRIEGRRPPEQQSMAWIERCSAQVLSGLDWLERERAAGTGDWFGGAAFDQADISTVCALTYIRNKQGQLFDAGGKPALSALAERAEALPIFRAVPFGADD